MAVYRVRSYLLLHHKIIRDLYLSMILRTENEFYIGAIRDRIKFYIWRRISVLNVIYIPQYFKTKPRGLSPRTNYTDRETAACWRN
jgi:hypothetical protein